MISYLGGLRREFHHVKTDRDHQEGFEPAMVLLMESRAGRAFIIPQQAIWKYVDPIQNNDAAPSDLNEFVKIANRCIGKLNGRDPKSGLFVPTSPKERAQARKDLAACDFASALWYYSKILPCTGYNLAKMIQMFDITPCPGAAAQLLLFIQNGLDELKNMPEAPPEKELVAGEVSLFEDGRKITQKDMTITESQLMIEEGEA